MKRTILYSGTIGVTAASAAVLIVSIHGTGFAVMTAVLYLYGIVAAIGGFIGYRRSLLRHRGGIADPSFFQMLGIDAVRERLQGTRWNVRLEEEQFTARSVEISENLVSLRRPIDGALAGISYPRSIVRSVERAD